MSKLEKELFVSGLSGTCVWEIQVFIMSTLIAYLSWALARNNLLASDFYFLIIPILVCCTFVDYSRDFMIFQLLLAYIVRMYFSHATTTLHLDRSINWRSTITTFRGFLQFTTICAILAVDFHIFPRRFAKTEAFGTSLMDLGVGGFVFSSGLVAGPKIFTKDLNISVWDSVKSTLVVLFIGIGRMIITKFIGYQEHVSEYGVHWNFFFTLGLLPLVMVIHKRFFKTISIWHVFLIIAAYTYALNNGLENYILNSPRTNFLNQNREGIFSFIGYYCIFLLSAYTGNELISKSSTLAVRFLVFSLLSGQALFFILTEYLKLQVSRRMANLTYVLWVYNVCVFMILGVAMINYIFPKANAPFIFESVNRNQLAIFLIANVLTGVVNISIDTLKQGEVVSFLILVVYLGIVSYCSTKLKTKLKF